MNIFGLVSLLIVAVIAAGVGVWWGSSRPAPAAPAEESAKIDSEVVESSYETPSLRQEVVEATQEVTESFLGGSVEVYKDISVAKNTQKLDLSGRGLEGSLKAEIRQLAELHELDISNNNFTGLPAEVGQLSKLEKLNLSNNPFTGLPHELANLHNLQILDLRGTSYAEYDLSIIRQGLPATVKILTD
jgi:Leucine-rich repeat (LRR) protein